MTQYPTTLYLIGNGFDQLHEVKSSYSMFRDYLKKRDRVLSLEMDTYFE
ncbi:AbiH family protein [Paenibacillus paridis]